MSAKRKNAAVTKSAVEKPVRKLLYPTERTSIPRERIRRAVDKVIAARRAAEELETSRK